MPGQPPSETAQLFFPPDLISHEGTAYKLRSGNYLPKPEVELVVIRLFFGSEENEIKTFWWVARDEQANSTIAGGRLMVTSMRDAVAAARFITKQRFRISRTRQENYHEPELTLEQWGLQYMELLARYALPSGDQSTEPGEYEQPTLF